MTRRVWLMTLKPGCEAEYKARHDAIWPELLDLMAANGIRDFTIHRHGLMLIAVQDRDTGPVTSEPDPVQWRWWAAMEPLMECHPDTRPIQIEVEDVFAFHADKVSKEP